MGFWSRDKDDSKNTDKVSRIPVWDTAQFIDADIAINCDKLSPGWYIYKQNFQWQCLKPDPSGQGFLHGYDFQTLDEAEDWLGVAVPQNLIASEQNRKSMAEQLKELQIENPGAGLADKPAPVVPQKSEHASKRKRNIDIHIKVSPEEYAAFRERVELTGMSQTNFLLQAALSSQIVIDESKKQIEEELQQLNEHLKQLRAEVGRIGGMLKMVIKPNEGQRELNPDEWESLIYTLRFLQSVKMKIGKTMEAINGYSKTHFI